MLVLTRKLNEQIRIGDDVTITVLRVKGNTIRLGIEAPRSTRVVRGELEPLDQASEAGRHASSDGTPTPAPGTPSGSPLAAYMPTKLAGFTAELSV